MPAQQRLGLDEEARPAGPGQDAADGGEQDAADGGEQGAVGGLEPESWRLAAQDRELVAQHKDLEILGGVAAGERREQLDAAAQREVGKLH
jgi:hypothetical protein